MGDTNSDFEAFTCRNCGKVSVDGGALERTDEELASVETVPIKHPELAVVLREVFGISETGIEVCIRLMEDRESTASDLADRLDMDRSTVSRQLNKQTELGVVEKHERALKGGGHVHVYTPVDVKEVRKRLTVGLYAWLNDAVGLIENINREKLQALARAETGDDGETTEIYWDG